MMKLKCVLVFVLIGLHFNMQAALHNEISDQEAEKWFNDKLRAARQGDPKSFKSLCKIAGKGTVSLQVTHQLYKGKHSAIKVDNSSKTTQVDAKKTSLEKQTD